MNINMQAPYEGTLEWVDTPRGGVSQNSGNEWKSVDFVLKYLDHQMQERIIVFSATGVERVNRLLGLPIGTPIRVTWAPGGRKYTTQQGEVKYFAQCEAISIVPVQQPVNATQQAPVQRPVQQPQAQPYGYPQPTQPAPVPPAPAAYPPQAPVYQENPNDLPF